MKNNLIFATYNVHKVIEVNKMLPDFNLLSLSDIQYNEDIEETGNTFHENAEIKANTIFKTVNKSLFADDSGLVIPSLGGEPGIYSARYAGTGDSADNIQKVLSKLNNTEDRRAYFICIICLILEEGEKHFFEGKIHGEILYDIEGENGFGYDPIFKPLGYDQSFAKISGDLKNKISHRAIAIRQMNEFLKNKLLK
ncbi:RdgB/HAM1 family non-canonical purine NTP pyrophosphatase [Flavobacteriaceae bacterium Ap0902]|nr:RdgB/HAM1 family non-canonical purine NTP pyrophosphatase [Flavobacteriaceae bacterium Ap0902]